MNKKINILMFAFLLLICAVAYVSTHKNNYVAYSLTTNSSKPITSIYIPTGSKGAVGDKIYVELNANTKVVTSISLFLKPTKSNGGTIVYLKSNSKDLSRNPYFIIPEDVVIGELYEVTQVNAYTDAGLTTYSTTESTEYPLLDTGSKRFITILEKSENPQEIEEIYLDGFDFPDNELEEIDNIPVNIEYDGNVSWATISFESIESSPITFSVPIYNIEDNQYIDLSSSNSFPGPGEYKVKELFLCNNDFGCTVYSNDGSYPDSIEYNFNENLIIKAKEEEKTVEEDPDNSDKPTSNYLVNNISFSSRNVSFGEKVTVDVDSNKELESVLLFLEDNNKNTLSAYLKDVNSEPYFILPSNVEDGIYYLKQAIVKSNGKTEYYNNKDIKILDYNSSITVKNSSTIKTNELRINNDSYKEEDYKTQFTNLDEDAIITVSASSKTLIDKSLFEMIKETRRKLIIEYKDSEWVFSGTDIKQPKTIDASILITNIEDSKIYSSKVAKDIPSNSKVINFNNNGELPGKVLMRIKSDTIDNMFKDKNTNIYYYDKDDDNFDKVAIEVQKNNGYYEFYINHNSIYIMSLGKIKEKRISNDDSLLEMNTDLYKDYPVEEEETEQPMDIVNVLLIVVVILLIAIFIVSSLKKSKQHM